jgi:hypothetical protein
MRTLIILIILAGGGYWWHSRHERYKEFSDNQGEFKSIENTINERKKSIAAVMQRLTPLREGREILSSPDGSPEKLEAAIDALRADIAKANEVFDTTEADYVAALNALREHAKTQPIPLLKVQTAGGGEAKEYKDCTISKFGEGYISFSHADGITKVRTDDLPEGWAEKFDVDYVSRESLADKEAIAARMKEVTMAPLDIKNAKLEQLDAAIAEVESQLLALAGGVRASQRDADRLERQAWRVVSAGGRAGEIAAAKRAGYMKQSKAAAAAGEVTREQYRALREQKLALERQRLELKKKRPSEVSP